MGILAKILFKTSALVTDAARFVSAKIVVNGLRLGGALKSKAHTAEVKSFAAVELQLNRQLILLQREVSASVARKEINAVGLHQARLAQHKFEKERLI